MRFSFKALALVLLSLAMSGTANAAIMLTSTVRQSGFFGFSPNPFPITGSTAPFDFTAQPYGSMSTIDSLTITLTINDGDTNIGEIDFNDFTLALDGIDTGIALNGFADALTLTRTISGTPANNAAILAALQSDGKLVGTIRDRDPNDNGLTLSASFNTTLVLTGDAVPEPTTIMLWCGLLSAVLGRAAFRARPHWRNSPGG